MEFEEPTNQLPEPVTSKSGLVTTATIEQKDLDCTPHNAPDCNVSPHNAAGETTKSPIQMNLPLKSLAFTKAFPAVIIPESIPSLDPRKFGASAEYHAPLQAHTASMPPRPSSAPTSPKKSSQQDYQQVVADLKNYAGSINIPEGSTLIKIPVPQLLLWGIRE